jgi:hypothetical protein
VSKVLRCPEPGHASFFSISVKAQVFRICVIWVMNSIASNLNQQSPDLLDLLDLLDLPGSARICKICKICNNLLDLPDRPN